LPPNGLRRDLGNGCGTALIDESQTWAPNLHRSGSIFVKT
jgi:hypothetical protein